MRYVRLFLLYLQDVFEYRSIAIVWFFVSVMNPLLYLLYWNGALVNSTGTIFTSKADVASYYFLYLIVGGFLMTHIEHEVAYWDIKEGGLVKYILKPLPYITFKFFTEFTWRIVMGLLAYISFRIITMFYGDLFTISLSMQMMVIIGFSMILGLLISFVFKMIIGLSALWVVEFSGIEQTIFVASLVFSGYVMPLAASPPLLNAIAQVTPFPYVVYYPVVMLQGKLSQSQSLQILCYQLLWVFGLSLLYKVVWSRGVKKFTGVGL